MRRLLPLLVAVTVALLPVASALAAEPVPPRLDARAWVLIDASDGERLAARSASRALPIASATKLMTAYLALRDLRPSDVLRAAAHDAAPAEVVLGLEPGERISVRDLLIALLLPSANDAAVTLAEGASGSVASFVRQMNRAARSLGLDETSYANPIGLDAPDNYSSAEDLAALTLELLGEPRFRRIVASTEARLRSLDSPRRVVTRNDLLRSVPWVNGVKTGHTNRAGYVFVGSAKRKGVTLVSVVLGAPSEAARDAETRRLLDYGFSLYQREIVVPEGRALAEPSVRYRDEALPLVAARPVEVTVREDQVVETAVEAPEQVEGRIEAGDRLGRAAVSVDGRDAGATPLLASRAVEPAGVWQVLGAWLPAPLIAAGAIVVLLGAARVCLRGSRGRSAEERMKHRAERRRRREERPE